MGIEIERKFLIRKDLWYAVKKPEGTGITQAYLVNEPGKVVRIRISGNAGFLTIKGATTGTSRPEFEFSIPAGEAREILGLFPSRKIEKTRYRLEFKGHTWEVDEFFGEDEGLVIAEIELTREDEPFETPPWIGEEVSTDPRYFNSYLAKNPFRYWK